MRNCCIYDIFKYVCRKSTEGIDFTGFRSVNNSTVELKKGPLEGCCRLSSGSLPFVVGESQNGLSTGPESPLLNSLESEKPARKGIPIQSNKTCCLRLDIFVVVK